MPTDEDEISMHYESAWMGLDELAHDIGEVKYQLSVYGDRRNKQVSELQDMLDKVLDICPADKITLLLLRDDPGLNKQIIRWQQQKTGVDQRFRKLQLTNSCLFGCRSKPNHTEPLPQRRFVVPWPAATELEAAPSTTCSMAAGAVAIAPHSYSGHMLGRSSHELRSAQSGVMVPSMRSWRV